MMPGSGPNLLSAPRARANPVRADGATLTDHRPVAAQRRQIDRQLNQAPHVAHLGALGQALNARMPRSPVVQRVGDDVVNGQQAPQPQQQPQLQQPQAQQPQQQPPQQQPQAPPQQAQQAQQQPAPAPAPEFSMANLLFASRAPDAQHAAERSLYFQGGRRLRLMHDAGPSVGRHTMDRYTFRHNAQANREFDEDDYDAAMRIADANERRNRLDEILAPVSEGGHGRLFEIEHGQYGAPDAGTHGSRGGVAPHGIDDEARLQRLVQIAEAGRNELPPLERAWEDAKRARRMADDRYDRAHSAVTRVESRLDAAEPVLLTAQRKYAVYPTGRRQRDVEDARQRVSALRAQLRDAMNRRRTARQRFYNAERAEDVARRAYEQRRDYYNGLVRAEFEG